jgi:hypothetical protein
MYGMGEHGKTQRDRVLQLAQRSIAEVEADKRLNAAVKEEFADWIATAADTVIGVADGRVLVRKGGR